MGPDTSRGLQPSEGFVGRAGVLSRLWAAFEKACASTGGVVLLAGEAGIGKTRTSAELAAAARAAGARVCSAWCEEARAAPYAPWTQLLQAYLRESGVPSLDSAPRRVREEIARLLPGASRVDSASEPRALEPSDRQQRLFDAVAFLLENAADQTPLLLVIDDLQLADPETLALLVHVARALADARALFVGTYRPDEAPRGSALARALEALARLPGHDRIALEGFDPGEIASFLAARSGTPAEPETLERVREHTGGNPLFLRELARLVAVEGRFPAALQRGAPRSANPAPRRELIERRLARLSPPCVALLGVAAVIGSDWTPEVLALASGLDPSAIALLSAEAERARLVEAHPERSGALRFAHALIQETLYQDLDGVRRRILHRRVADALDVLHDKQADAPHAELARHLCLAASAEVADKLAAFTLRAASAALERLAEAHAAALCRRALATLDALRAGSLPARCDLLLLLAEATSKLGLGDEHREVIERASVLARRLGSPERQARSVLHLGSTETGVVRAEAVRAIEEALAALGPEHDGLRAALLTVLAQALYWSDADLPRARAACEEARAIAERLGDVSLRLQALRALRFASWSVDNLRDRERLSLAMVALGLEFGRDDVRFMGHVEHLQDALELGSGDGSARDFAAIRELGVELGFSSRLLSSALALRATLDGALADAERAAASALEFDRRSLNPNAAVFAGIRLLAIRIEQGRLAEMLPAVRSFVERYSMLPAWRCMLAYLHAEEGDLAAAAETLEALDAHDFARARRDPSWLQAIAMAGETAARLDDVPRAHRYYALLEPYADRVIVVGPSVAVYSAAARPLALLAATLGDSAAAEAHFARALGLEEAIGARCLAARTRQQWAEWLVARGRGRDQKRARALCEDALRTAQTLGLARTAERARALLHGAGRA